MNITRKLVFQIIKTVIRLLEIELFKKNKCMNNF